jgi:hypothetical protein
VATGGLLAPPASAEPPTGQWALQPSDVVFMYQAAHQTYEDYGATVLAWGGRPTPESLQAAEGVVVFGSVGMVTEFARYHDRFPESWASGLCRDVHGQPYRVPWLTDHEHEGIPFWWCCTRQPTFRTYIEERVVDTVRRGAFGVHVDDHLGSSGSLFLGGCLCNRCVEGFRRHLAALAEAHRERLGIAHPETFDYGAVLRAWLAEAAPGEPRRVQDHPLWDEWVVYQTRGAATFMSDLRGLVRREAGREVPMSANAGLLWPHQLVDYESLDFFSAEIEHEAADRRLSDRPLFAYRMADAVGRPLASTASGQDWAFVKEHGLSGLVRGWIAGSYAAGHNLMAPHRQWCYTKEKGTHWYDGPSEVYAPVYRFVRAHAELFAGLRAWADVALVMPHRSFRRDREPWLARGRRLAEANVAYRLVLGGDAVVDHRITPESVEGVSVVINPEAGDLLPTDRRTVETSAGPRVDTVGEARALVSPAVSAEGPLRLLPRVGEGRAVIHLLNRAYEPQRDAVRPLNDVELRVDLQALGVAGCRRARVLSPDAAPTEVSVSHGRLIVPEVGFWTLVVLERG